MKIAIVKYNAGNIRSVDFALQRLGVKAEITDDPETLQSADKVIFPGVGEASTTMAYLRARKLDRLIAGLRQPVLGICLGLQLMCARSQEGETACIGIFDLPVLKFDPGNKVPHMGWNSLQQIQGRLIPPEMAGAYVYFVHSYYAPVGKDTAASTAYNNSFSAALERDNFFATQFHPEKSGPVGGRILERFLAL